MIFPQACLERKDQIDNFDFMESFLSVLFDREEDVIFGQRCEIHKSGSCSEAIKSLFQQAKPEFINVLAKP